MVCDNGSVALTLDNVIMLYQFPLVNGGSSPLTRVAGASKGTRRGEKGRSEGREKTFLFSQPPIVLRAFPPGKWGGGGGETPCVHVRFSFLAPTTHALRMPEISAKMSEKKPFLYLCVLRSAQFYHA